MCTKIHQNYIYTYKEFIEIAKQYSSNKNLFTRWVVEADCSAKAECAWASLLSTAVFTALLSERRFSKELFSNSISLTDPDTYKFHF